MINISTETGIADRKIEDTLTYSDEERLLKTAFVLRACAFIFPLVSSSRKYFIKAYELGCLL